MPPCTPLSDPSLRAGNLESFPFCRIALLSVERLTWYSSTYSPTVRSLSTSCMRLPLFLLPKVFHMFGKEARRFRTTAAHPYRQHSNQRQLSRWLAPAARVPDQLP